jgi:DnaJ-class molecular chaperone
VAGIIDRLGDFLRSVLGDEEPSRGRPAGGQRFVDPDVQEAWQELDDFMRTGTEPPRQDGAGESRAGDARRAARDEALRQDYANLEVPFGADIETVRRSYKHLILKYHPDKYAGDPQKQKAALEITKKINESFEKIRGRQGG